MHLFGSMRTVITFSNSSFYEEERDASLARNNGHFAHYSQFREGRSPAAIP